MATPILSTRRSTASRSRPPSSPTATDIFYAIDRTNGQFLYAIPLVEGINWTTGIDPITGKPDR